jgi:hypothetical protein
METPTTTSPKELDQFGLVERFEFIGDKLHVKITKGFNPNFYNTLACFNEIQQHAGKEYQLLGKLRTDHDIFEMTLIKAGEWILK